MFFNGFRALFAPAFRFPLCVQQDKIYALIVNYRAQGVVTWRKRGRFEWNRFWTLLPLVIRWEMKRSCFEWERGLARFLRGNEKFLYKDEDLQGGPRSWEWRWVVLMDARMEMNKKINWEWMKINNSKDVETKFDLINGKSFFIYKCTIYQSLKR